MSGRKATETRIAGEHALAVGDADMFMPSGWIQTRLLDIARLESGHTPSRRHPEYWDGDVPWIGIKDARIYHTRRIVETLQTVTEEGLANSAARWLPKDTVCLSRTASVGYVTVLGKPMATSQDFVNWVCSEAIEPEFLMRLFQAEERALKQRFGKGSTHTTIYFPEVKAFHVSLPPLNEQRRIVAKLDACMSHTKKAKEALDAIPPLLEKFRQSVLAAAFRGDLTKDWREKNKDVEPISDLLAQVDVQQSKTGRAATDSVIEGRAAISVGLTQKRMPCGWRWTPLTDVARLESGHTPSRKKPSYWGGEVPWIGIPDARDNHGRVIDETATCTNQLGLANSAARVLPKGTVCLSRTASVGYVTIMGRPMATSQDFVNWVCSAALEPEFLMFALLAEGDDIRRFGKGTTHTTIYYPEVKAMHLCIPPVAEQNEIVRRVKGMFSRMGRFSAIVDLAHDSAAVQDAALLAKAFRGELVPQDPSDEAASVLLERIHVERDAAAATTPQKTRRRTAKKAEPAP